MFSYLDNDFRAQSCSEPKKINYFFIYAKIFALLF